MRKWINIKIEQQVNRSGKIMNDFHKILNKIMSHFDGLNYVKNFEPSTNNLNEREWRNIKKNEPSSLQFIFIQCVVWFPREFVIVCYKHNYQYKFILYLIVWFYYSWSVMKTCLWLPSLKKWKISKWQKTNVFIAKEVIKYENTSLK